MGRPDWLQIGEKYRSFDNRMQHSTYYHKRFEGWVEQCVTGADGKRRIERTYAGPWFEQDITDRRRAWNRIAYAALYLLAAGLFLYASTRSTASSHAFLVSLLSFFSLAALFMLLVTLITYLASPRRMTLWEHTAGPLRLKAVSLAAALLLAAEALVITALTVSRPGAGLVDELAGIAALVASALALYAIHGIERRIPYPERPNDCEPPRGGYCIDA